MNENTMNTLLNKLINIENRLHGIECEFINYVEANPKTDDQWVEQRLRALEDQMKSLLAAYNMPMDANNVVKADLEYHEKSLKVFEERIHKLEKYCNDDRNLLTNEIEHANWNEQRVDGLEILLHSLQQKQNPEQYNDR